MDPILLTQVVFNLLDNAIKYFRGTPNEFSITIQAAVAEMDYELVFFGTMVLVCPTALKKRFLTQVFEHQTPRD